MRRARVLLADDHRIFSEGLRELLDPEFEVVGVVEDGRALVARAKELCPDVIVADISMPTLNGIEAAVQLQKADVPSKVVFLTVHQEVAYAARAFDLGSSGFVRKHSAKEVASILRISPRTAEDILRRILWWGERMPYWGDSLVAERIDGFDPDLARHVAAERTAHHLQILRPTSGNCRMNPHDPFAAGDELQEALLEGFFPLLGDSLLLVAELGEVDRQHRVRLVRVVHQHGVKLLEIVLERHQRIAASDGLESPGFLAQRLDGLETAGHRRRVSRLAAIDEQLPRPGGRYDRFVRRGLFDGPSGLFRDHVARVPGIPGPLSREARSRDKPQGHDENVPHR